MNNLSDHGALITDHQLIAERIYTMAAGDLSREVADQCATYVLKGISNRLLPEVPEWVREVKIRISGGEKVPSLFTNDPNYYEHETRGIGPTIFDAVINALES